MSRALRLAAITLAAALAFGPRAAVAQMGMPDAKAMSGVPLPMGNMPIGTVTVRVVRGDVANFIADQDVDLTADGATKTARTDATGRATFEGLKPGATVTIRAVVGRETLDSQEFRIPSEGGVRLMLVATDPNTPKGGEPAGGSPAAPAAPAQPGDVSLGSQSRIHVELTEEAADVYYLLDIVNAAKTPVDPKTPFVIELPDGATGSTILEGSSPAATAAGRRITVRGPFAPGATQVQVAFRLPYSGGHVAFTQAFPAAFQQPVLSITKKLPGVRLGSSTFHDAREMPNEGQTLLVAHAKATPAHTPLDVRVEGVPSHPAWPRTLALALAAIIIAAGAWGTATARTRVARRNDATRQLQARREKLLTDLAALDARRRAGTVPEAQYQRRRQQMIDELERIYSAMDEAEGAAA